MTNRIAAYRFTSSAGTLAQRQMLRALGGTLPFILFAMPGVAQAQVSNSATITAPAGAIEANTGNNSATDTDTLLATIVATNDSATGINGRTGATAVVNAFTGDTVNSAAATAANAVLSVAAGSTVPTGLTFNTSTGAVNVAAGTAAGTYSFNYQICEAGAPTNCKIATISVIVVAAPISADADSVTGVNGTTGANDVLNVIDGDLLNNVQVVLADINLTVTSPATPATTGAPVPTLNVTTGLVSVPANTPAGTYSIGYRICEKLNPTSCANNIATVTVVGGAVIASNDSVSGINGRTGATAVLNAFTGDTINGAPADATNATLAVAVGSTVPAGLTFNTATGAVDVAAGTPTGTYSFDYTLCEKINTTNCKTATISVTVAAAPISADADSVSGINGVTGAANVLDVIDGDLLNNAQVVLADVNLTVTTPATPATPGAPVPTLNVATGRVSVPSNTPAGTYTITYQICEKLNPSSCASNVATVTVSPSVDLQITKTDGKTEVMSGETVTYTVTVTNAGPDAATGAKLTDTVGSGLTCPATNPLAFSGAGIPSGSFTIGNLTGAGVTLGTIGNGQSITVTYNCTVN